jgi:ribosomal protein S12 methylthiotransferase
MPEEVTDEIIESFSNPGIIPYFDLPFQHVSPNILKAMNRGGGFREDSELIRKIRKAYKDAVIRSSLIVGFPGETEENFEELMKFAETTGIERIGVFGYSEEEGTAAFGLEEKVQGYEIEERKERLMDVSDRNMGKYNEKITDRIMDFLPLGPWDNNTTIGRIKSQSPDTDGLTVVNAPFDDDYEMYQIVITGFESELLYGEKV